MTLYFCSRYGRKEWYSRVKVAVDDGIIIASLSYFIGVSCSTIERVAFSPSRKMTILMMASYQEGIYLAMRFYVAKSKMLIKKTLDTQKRIWTLSK